MKKQWYEDFFKNYARTYDKERFTLGTLTEVDFIEKEISYNKKSNILDIGCGTGRHAIELAKRGYRQVVGIDLSSAQLTLARLKAKQAGMQIRFIRADARKLKFNREFDLVIMLCEGAFPLMETDEMNFAILKNAAKALKKNGVFIFTTLNGLFPLFHSVKDFINREQGQNVHEAMTFDLMTFRDYSVYEQVDDDGNKRKFKCNERYYVPSEISWLLKSLGFLKIDILGAETGVFDRRNKLTTEHYEMLVVARRK
jgi:ubiquinone/menaquinone biosynthesis C-methylase UbiE